MSRQSHSIAARRTSRSALTRVVAALEILEHRVVLSSPPILGPELVLPGDTTPALSVGQQTAPSLAEGPDGISLAVWQDTRSGGNPNVYGGAGLGTMTDIYAARVRADGSVIDVTPIPIAANSYNQTMPKAAWNGTNWLVAWSTEREFDRYEGDIQAVRVAPSGAILDAVPLVIGTHLPNPYGSDDLDPYGPLAVASNGSDWFVQWRHHNPNLAGGIGMEWFATKVTAGGQVPDQEGVKLLEADQYTQDFGIAFSSANGGQFLHAYQLYQGATYTRRYDAQMNFIPGSQQTAIGGGEKMAIAGSPTGWIMAWEGYFGAWPQIQAARIAPSGALIDAQPLEITDPTYGVDFSLDAEWNGVDWTMAYSNYAMGGGFDQDIFACRVSPTAPSGTAVGPVHPIIAAAGHQSNPQLIGSGDGGYKMLYSDAQSLKPGVAVAVISSGNVLLAQADASLAAPSQGVSELASDGSNFLMVFSSSTGYGTRLLGQRLTPQGVALDQDPFVIADVAQKSGSSYEVVYLNGTYVVIFNADSGPQGKQVYARTVTADGVVGAQVALVPNAPFTGFSLGDASVNGDRLILVGNANEGNAHRSSRFARIFNSNLVPLTDRFMFGGGFALSGDTEPVSGGWVATWANLPSHDAPRATVYYAVIGTDGAIVKTETPITANYPGNGRPTVVSNGGDAASEAMIIFTQARNGITPQIVNEDAIRAQRVLADGAPIGGTITLIDEPQLQTTPDAIFDGTEYVMVWTDQRNYPYPAQARDDIFAARVAVDGTVIDPGGFAVADTFRPEMQGDVAVAGGEVMFAYRTFRHEAPWGSYRLAARAMGAEPGIAPAATEQPAFDFERDQAVRFVFNKPMMGADSGDLIVRNLTTGQTIAASDLTVQVIGAGATGWTYRWKYTGGILPDGRYTATLPVGTVTDFAGRPLAADLVINFHVLAGDATRDARVNLDDFNVLAANFGGTNKTFSQGDFNYDGRVNLEDFNILAGRFGASVAAPASAGASPAARVGAGLASDDEEAIGLS